MSYRFSCNKCDYVTNRLSNYKAHIERKIPCDTPKKSLINSDNVSNAVSGKSLVCPCCKAVFQNRQAKYRHMKKNSCESPKKVEGDVEMNAMIIKLRCMESKVKELEASKATTVVNHNTTYITDNSSTTNTMNTDNSCGNTVNNCITYHNYDEPNLEHIDAQVIKKLYFDNGRHLKKMVNEAVRKIYKKPENNTFRFPQGIKSNFVEVRYRDEKRLLPMKEVIETVLTKTSLVCEEHLRDHYYGGTIVGSAVLTHANDLEDLAIQPWDDDKANRADFHPYVKSAIIECI